MKIYNKNYVLNFDGGHLKIAALPVFDLAEQLTIAAWVKPSKGIQGSIVGKKNSAYEAQINGKKLVFSSGREFSGSSKIVSDQWVHLVITFDATEAQDNIKLYVNGDLDKTFNNATALRATNDPLWIGARPDGSMVFKGKMASVALWNVAHSGWQVKKDLGSPVDTTDQNLVGYWQMEDGTGTVVKDLSTQGNNAQIVGEVTWEEVTDPVMIRPPLQKKLKNTTVQRISQLLDQPGESHLEDHTSLSGSGRNGEATKFLNRVKTYKAEQIAAKTRETNAQVKDAKAAQAAKLKEAHIEAAKKMNSTRFDQLWFIFKNNIHFMDPLGRLSEFNIGSQESKTVTVPAKDIWFDTGVDSGPQDTVSIKYISGKWSVSPAASNLTAVGTARYIAKNGYALPGRFEGCLVGKVSDGIILAIGMDNKLYTRNNLNSSWVKAPDKGGSVKGIAIMPNETILAIGMDNKLYTRKDLNSSWVKAPDKGGQVQAIAIMHDDSILAIGMDNKLYTRANLNTGWVKAPDKGGKVQAITVMNDGTILAVGMDRKLYTRANLNDSWVKAPDKSGLVTGITIMQDGTILAIGTDHKLYTRANLNSSWKKAPDKNGQVQGVCLMPSVTTPFYVGNEYEVPKSLSGRVYLTSNDDVESRYGAGYADNSGSLQVQIKKTKESTSVEAADLIVDQGRGLVFWCQATAPFSLHVAATDGSNHKKLLDHPGSPITSVALDEENQYIYYLAGTGTIMRVQYDGNGNEELLDISGPSKEHYWQLEIEQKGGKIYWTNDFSIWRADLDGKNAELVISNHEAPFPIDLAVDGESGKLYWVDKELQVVRRANLDGSEPEDLYLARNPVRGLMLDYVTPEMRDVLKQEVYWAAREEKITANTPGIIDHWPLDEGQGVQFKSSIHAFKDFYLGVKRVSDDLPTNLGYPSFALKFEGNDYVRVPNNHVNELSKNSFTIEMWVKAEDPTYNQGLMAATNYKNNKCLHLVIRNQKAYMGFYGNDTPGKSKIEANKWTHLAFRYDMSKKEQAIFINGELDALTTGHSALNMNPDTLTWLGSYAGRNFRGLMADVRIIHQVLSQEAIAQTMELHKPGDLMGELITGPTWDRKNYPPTLNRKQAVLNFDGIGSYLKIGDAQSLKLAQHSFTVESWVRVNQFGDGDLSILGTDTTQASKGLHLVIRNKKPYMGFYSDDLAGSTALAEGEWNHIAFRYEAASNTQAIFLNGQRIGQRKSKADFLGDGQVFVGRWAGGRIFNGMISELRIWDTARSPQDIAANYMHYRESFALRGPVDGSEEPEHLFEIPAEGGLNLLSRLKADYEKRLMAYRKRKENQAIAAAQVQAAHADSDKKVKSKSEELTRTQQEKASEIDAKKAQHAREREGNRNRLIQGQNDKSQKIANARKSAQQSRANADQQAAEIKSKANADASSMKSKATNDRDAARSERDKNRR